MVRKALFLATVMLLIMTACSGESETKTSKAKDTYTPKEAAKDGHVVVHHLSNSLKEVLNGAVKNKNLAKLFAFVNDVKAGKKSKLKVTIFNKDGSYETNSLSFDGKKLHYDNNYKGYKDAPSGKYECTSYSLVRAQGIFQLGPCKKSGEAKEKKYFMLAVIGTVQGFREAEAKAQ